MLVWVFPFQGNGIGLHIYACRSETDAITIICFQINAISHLWFWLGLYKEYTLICILSDVCERNRKSTLFNFKPLLYLEIGTLKSCLLLVVALNEIWYCLIDQDVDKMIKAPIPLALHEITLQEVMPCFNKHVCIAFLKYSSVLSVYC